MRYVTTVERFIIERETQKVAQQVAQQVMQQGIQQGESKLLMKLLERRFGILPAGLADKLGQASEQELETWGEAVLTAPTLEAVFNNAVN